MRRTLLAVAAVALVAGCGSTVPPAIVGANGTPVVGGDDGLGAPTAAPGQPGAVVGPGGSGVPGSTAAGPGATVPGTAASPGATQPTSARGTTAGTPVRTPLKIGVAFINNQQASSMLGTNDPRTNSVKQVIEAYVRGINKVGGLAGRRLEVVEYEWHSGDGSWSSAAASACAKFTQDNHVSVVLDQAFGTVGGFRDCLQRAGVFDITNQGVGDDVAGSRASLYAGVGGLTVDRAYGAVLSDEVRSGYLSAKSQIGILVESCPENLRAYSRTLLPLTKRLGLATPKTYQFDCVDNTATGAGEGQAAISNAILRFRQPPAVDRVMFVSGQEAAALLLFSNTASSQSYRPGYLLSSSAQAHLATEGGSGVPADQLPQLHGVGNSPYGDVSDAAATVVDARCLGLLRAGGSQPANYDDKGQAVFNCGPFLLLETLLQRTSGDAAPASLAAAARGLGTAFASPGVLAGSTWYSSSHRDGGDLVQTFGYVGSCRCIRYSGRPVHAPG